MKKRLSRQAGAKSDSNAGRAEAQLDIDRLDKAEREIKASPDQLMRTITGGIYWRVDMIIPRIFDLREKNHAKPEAGAVTME